MMTDMENKLGLLIQKSFDDQYAKRNLLTAYHTAEDLIANGVTVQEWISVEDRLPENRQRVLIYDGGATQWNASVRAATFVKGRTHDEIMQEYRQTGRLYYTFGDEEGNNKKPYRWKGDAHMTWFGQHVTHWMPLPEPPKKEENSNE